MTDGTHSILVEAKREYTNQLIDILKPNIFKDINDIYNESLNGGDFRQFQKNLCLIHKWDNTFVNDIYNQIIINSRCEWLPELITAVFVSYTKILNSVNDNKNIDINLSIPNIISFIHKCYINVARYCWKNIYLFNSNVNSSIKQQNMSIFEDCIERSIIETIRIGIPIKDILMSSGYLKIIKPDKDIIISKLSSISDNKLIEINNIINDSKEKSPEPDVKEKSPEPEGKEKSPEPEGKEKSPEPEGKEKSPEPEGKEKSPEPEVKKNSPEPEVKEKSPEPEVKEKSPEPEVKEKSPEPEDKENSPEPEVKEKSPDPEIKNNVLDIEELNLDTLDLNNCTQEYLNTPIETVFIDTNTGNKKNPDIKKIKIVGGDQDIVMNNTHDNNNRSNEKKKVYKFF